MSIHIKGVEMPAEGVLCIDIFPDGRVAGHYDCTIKHAKAVPVPPHGRLIDAEGNVSVNVRMMPGGKCEVDLIAPTIIPAEEAEK